MKTPGSRNPWGFSVCLSKHLDCKHPYDLYASVEGIPTNGVLVTLQRTHNNLSVLIRMVVCWHVTCLSVLCDVPLPLAESSPLSLSRTTATNGNCHNLEEANVSKCHPSPLAVNPGPIRTTETSHKAARRLH